MRLREISKVISVGVEDKKFSKRQRHDVLLVLLFWLGALEFKILKFLFFRCLNIFLGNFPLFSVHKSLKTKENSQRARTPVFRFIFYKKRRQTTTSLLTHWLTVVCETKWNETKWNEMKGKSVVCEMGICSLRNGNL